MQCSGCGTFIEGGGLTCPNCGRMVWSRGKKAAPASPPTLPKAGDSAARMEDELELSEPAMDSAPPAAPAAPAAAAGTFTLDAGHVRDLLSREPEHLEEGLSVLTEKNKPVGVDYSTDVGPIDLLARDSRGGLVVVMVSKADSGSDLVAEILQRVGWVRKHVARASEGVRGVVVMERAPENLSYAAAAVSDTVSFRTYRMTVRFDKVDL
jgi:hypothetical protein